ncbi:hypothetical protein AAMO2058_000905800, partial [Amorphochlora amoebiformis]
RDYPEDVIGALDVGIAFEILLPLLEKCWAKSELDTLRLILYLRKRDGPVKEKKIAREAWAWLSRKNPMMTWRYLNTFIVEAGCVNDLLYFTKKKTPDSKEKKGNTQDKNRTPPFELLYMAAALAKCYSGLPHCEDEKHVKVSKGDIKKAYVELMKRPECKSELITRIREQMTDRVKATIRHMVQAPPSNVSGYKAFHGLDAMVCLIFRLFGLKVPVAAGLDSYNFTGFDADISAEWILMTRKTAGRDGLNAIGYTSQDSLSNGNALEKVEFIFLHNKKDDLKELGSMVKQFELRLLNLAPKEKFAWLRGFLVTLRGFSVEALELKTLPNGEVKYRNLESDEGKSVLASMSTFVMQNNDKLVECFRDVVASQDHATELRLQLLRAILAMPSDRRASHLITYAS